VGDKLKMIPLCQLQRSKINVRKTEPLIDIGQLAANIAEKGLLENLVVRPVPRSGRTTTEYEVTAGGRRLAALKLLARRGKIERKHLIRCLVRNDDDSGAVEVSLSENFSRVHLHPADQFEAFAVVHQKGASADDIAARFGVTPTFVEQRLKLAAVSPRLIAEYRSGAMTLEQFTAFTICDDHGAQEAVWFDRPYAEMPALMIRRLLTKAQVEGTDRRARFIGTSAYREAGGTIVRDLFDAEDEGYFSDSQLLDRLVAEKLETSAKAVRVEGWQWVGVYPETDFGQLSRYGRANTVIRKLGKVEEKRLARLGKRYDKLITELEESDASDSDELDRVAAELAALQAKKEAWPDKEKARAGAIVSLGPDGTLQVARGLVRRDKVAQAANEDAEPTGRTRRDGYADSVLVDLSAHRTAALRESLAAKPEEALFALLEAFVSQLLYRGEYDGCIRIHATAVTLDRASASVGASLAAAEFAERHASWMKQLPEIDQLAAWLRQMSKAERLRLLAHCVSMTVNALHGTMRHGAGEDSDRLAAALGLDMAAWWRPTVGNFLNRLTKTEILAAVSEGVSAEAARPLAGIKKEAMATEAEKLLANAAWLPVSLRPAAVAVAEAAE
jgi:ParB family chromosome partitioning protein